ncbi:protein of unknown function [Pseudomonas sp. JV551A1]|nr:protein of unknown function [Pseudomonas sp. JV551A1]
MLNSCKVGCRNRVPGIFIPQLEFVQLPHQHRLLVELGVLTQTGRHQETPTAIELQVNRITDQQALQAAVFLTQRWQGTQLGFYLFPLIEGVNTQAGVNGVDGHDQLTIATRIELVTVPARHGETTLGIEADGVGSAEHGCDSPQC